MTEKDVIALQKGGILFKIELIIVFPRLNFHGNIPHIQDKKNATIIYFISMLIKKPFQIEIRKGFTILCFIE